MSDVALAQLAVELRGLELRRQESGLTGVDSLRHDDLVRTLFQRVTEGPGGERRQHLRVPAELEVRFRMSGAAVTCSASELSHGGLGLCGHLWITEDQELVVENLRIGKRDYPVAIRARVVWKTDGEAAPPRAGLAFLDLDEGGERQIHAVFERLFLAFLDHLSG